MATPQTQIDDAQDASPSAQSCLSRDSGLRAVQVWGLGLTFCAELLVEIYPLSRNIEVFGELRSVGDTANQHTVVTRKLWPR